MASYPHGWTDSNIDKGVALARSLDAAPRDLFALWYFESGLDPHIVSAVGYYGLIQTTPGFQPNLANIVVNGTIDQQLDEIARVWASSAQNYLHESFASRAAKLGVSTPALIYAMNACPALAANARTADEPIFVQGAGGDSGMCYGGNPVFDHQQKGYITLHDFQDHLATYRAKGEQTPPVNTIFAALPADVFSPGTNWKLLGGAAAILLLGGGVGYWILTDGGRKPLRL
jgi:hypothetical protein